jgi:uncharacterized damage-inducible protein DinB
MTASGSVLDQERADLLETLATHRGFLRFTVRDLSDDQARERTTVSELCLGGLIKHVTRVEKNWAEFIVKGSAPIGSADVAAFEAHAASFHMEQSESLEGLLEEYDRVARRTDDLVVSLASLDLSHLLPEAPWFEPGARWSARRALVHIIAETAQHAGHADIIREALDGAKTMG